MKKVLDAEGAYILPYLMCRADLRSKDKLILCLIVSKNESQGIFDYTNKAIADFFGKNVYNISRGLTKLKRLGYIVFEGNTSSRKIVAGPSVYRAYEDYIKGGK